MYLLKDKRLSKLPESTVFGVHYTSSTACKRVCAIIDKPAAVGPSESVNKWRVNRQHGVWLIIIIEYLPTEGAIAAAGGGQPQIGGELEPWHASAGVTFLVRLQ